MLKVDPHTGEEFFTNKRNKKFASKSNQVAYNNELFAVKRESESLITERLHHNQTIIRIALNGTKSTTVTKEYLIARGFNFYSITHFKKKDNTTFYGIFEFTYSVINNEQFKIEENGKQLLA